MINELKIRREKYYSLLYKVYGGTIIQNNNP